MTDDLRTTQIKNELETYFQRGAPRAAFVTSMRQRLLAEAGSTSISSRRTFFFPHWLEIQPAWRLIATAILTICLVAVLAVGPQQVLAAVQGLIGYIPGLGFVINPASARVLDKPITQTQTGVSFTITDAVADEAQTRIFVKVEGIRDLWKNDYSGTQDFSHPSTPHLTYPGGSLSLDRYSQAAVGDTYISLLMVFPPLPGTVTNPVLNLQQVAGISTSIVPGNWSVPLHFRAGSANGHIHENVEQIRASNTQNGITLTLDSIIRMQNNDVLRVGMTSSQPDTRVKYAYSQLLVWTPDGHPIPFVNQKIIDPPFVIVKTFPSQRLVPGTTYTLKVDGPVVLSKPIPAGGSQTEFMVDLGANPQVGQSWPVDQTVTVDGKQVHVRAVRMSLGTNGMHLTFDVDLLENVAGVTIEPVPTSQNVVLIQGGTTTFLWDGTKRQSPPVLYYQGTPSGKLTFQISAIDYLVQGPWAVTWTMPDLPLQQ
jgi:hypothetical protein